MDLYFRDETEEVSRRVNKKKKGGSESRSDSPTPDLQAEQKRERTSLTPVKPAYFNGLVDTCCDQYPGTFSMTYTPSQDVAFTAISFFITSFLEGSNFDYLPPIYLQSNQSSPLAVATQCVAMASLAADWRDSRLMNEARKQYSEALTLTNAALRSPADAVQDGTLISVLLLALFETLAFEGRHSPDDWTAHTLGAATLIRLRGKEQFNTYLGRRLFLQVATNLRVSHAQQKKRVPEEFKKLEEAAWSSMDRSNPAIRLASLTDTFANLRADLRALTPRDPATVIERCKEVNRKAVELLESFPPEYQYEVLGPDQAPSWAFRGTAHRYPNSRIALYYNAVRMIRLFIHEWIYFHAQGIIEGTPESSTSSITGSLQDLQEDAKNVAHQMIFDILATVPQFTQLSTASPPLTSRFLIWPLAAVGETTLVPPGGREYAIKCLRLLGDLSRMRQASKAAEMLEEGKLLEDW